MWVLRITLFLRGWMMSVCKGGMKPKLLEVVFLLTCHMIGLIKASWIEGDENEWFEVYFLL